MPPTPRQHEAELDVVALQLAQTLGDSLERAAHVGLEDQVQRGRLAALDLLEQVLQLGTAQRRGGGGHVPGHPVAVGAGLTDGAGLGQLRGDPELVTGLGRLGEPEYLDRRRRGRLLDLVPVVVDQGLHLAPCGASHDRVADPQGALLHDDRGHRPTTDLELRLDDDAPGTALGRRLQLLDLGDQHDLLQQVLDAEGLQGRHLDGDGVAAPGLGHESVLRQLLEHAVGVGLVPVDLVDRHDDRHVGRVGVADGLDGLGHDAVIGGHHQDHDVGHLGTTGTHGREGFVTGGVDERDRVALPLDLVGTDVLGDATGLAGHDVGRADTVEQQGLAVVDVAHDGDDRRARAQLRLVHFLVVVVEELGQQLGLALLARVDESDLGAEFGGEQLDHVVGQRLGGRDHLPLQQQEADHITGGAVQLGPEVACRRAALDDDLVLGHGGRRGRVRRESRRLQLLEVPTAPTGSALVGTASSDTGSTPTSGATGSTGATAGAATGSSTAVATGRATGPTAVAAAGGTGGTPGARGAGTTGPGTAGAAGESGTRGAGSRAPSAGPGGRRDRLARDRAGWAAGRRRNRPAGRAGRRARGCGGRPGWRPGCRGSRGGGRHGRRGARCPRLRVPVPVRWPAERVRPLPRARVPPGRALARPPARRGPGRQVQGPGPERWLRVPPVPGSVPVSERRARRPVLPVPPGQGGVGRERRPAARRQVGW